MRRQVGALTRAISAHSIGPTLDNQSYHCLLLLVRALPIEADVTVDSESPQDLLTRLVEVLVIEPSEVPVLRLYEVLAQEP